MLPKDWRVKKSINSEFNEFDLIIKCATKKMAQNYAKSILINQDKAIFWDEYCKSGEQDWVKNQIILVSKLENEIKSLKYKNQMK